MGKTKRQLHIIGNAHIDPVWMWKWQEGYTEVIATFSSALDRLEESPDIYFNCSSAAYYKWVEETSPQMFERITQKVKEGRWVIVGGWWVQPDCNIPSGESFVRHSLYAQRYFLEKFGCICRAGYNVDSFGHSVALPQILKKSGMDFYVMMRPSPEENPELPFLFWWKGLDDSKILTYKIPFSYNNSYSAYPGDEEGINTDPLELKIKATSRLAEQNGIDMMCFFGIGNHGGGPTKRDIKLIRGLMGKDGLPEILFSTPEKYFKKILRESRNIPEWEKDLLHHSTGCYTSHSKIKKDNRYAENRLLQAEKFITVANCFFGEPYPREEIKRAWENVLFNQFHDIMGGCSIKSSYEDAGELHGEALSIGARVLNKAVQKISRNINTIPDSFKNNIVAGKTNPRLWDISNHGAPIVLFNTLSWGIKIPVVLDKSIKSLRDDSGRVLPRQEIHSERTHKNEFVDNIFFAEIPAMGYSTYWGFTSITENHQPEQTTTSGEYYMENGLIKVVFDSSGYIYSIYDKENNENVIKAPAAVPVIIDDKGDAWGHNIVRFQDEIGKMDSYEIKVVEKGPLRACIRVKSRYGLSEIWQDFMLYPHSKDISVSVKLIWHEKCKMLKLSFPVNVEDPIATYETQYGFISREADGEEMPAQSWADVTGKTGSGEYGVSIANDSKYAYSINLNKIQLTITRSPAFAWHFTRILEADKDYEYIDEGIQTFKYLIIPHKGDWRKGNTVKKAWELNNSPIIVYESYHRGSAPRTASFIDIDKNNIIASVFKKAEGSENYILRCYETEGVKTEARIRLNIGVDMTREWRTVFNKNEIKTYHVSYKNNEVREVNLIELEGSNINDLYQV